MKYKWENPSGSYVKLKISKNPWYKDYNLNGFVNLKKYKENLNILKKKKNNYKTVKKSNNTNFKNKYIIFLLLLILIFFILKY